MKSTSLSNASIIATGAILLFAPVPYGLLNATTAEPAQVAPNGVERYACEEATKMQLRDPDSYQKIEFRRIDSTQASLTFRARNGFGGYDTGAAACTVEGTGVRSVLLPL